MVRDPSIVSPSLTGVFIGGVIVAGGGMDPLPRRLAVFAGASVEQ